MIWSTWVCRYQTHVLKLFVLSHYGILLLNMWCIRSQATHAKYIRLATSCVCMVLFSHYYGFVTQVLVGMHVNHTAIDTIGYENFNFSLTSSDASFNYWIITLVSSKTSKISTIASMNIRWFSFGASDGDTFFLSGFAFWTPDSGRMRFGEIVSLANISIYFKGAVVIVHFDTVATSVYTR